MQLIQILKNNLDAYPFHMPGHKRSLADDDLLESIYGIDITEIKGFDDLHNAGGIIKDAEERCAALFKADETHFLVNGSTCGILAAICGSVTSSDDIIVARNCHRSVFNAVMLSGADMHMVTPGIEPWIDTYGGVKPESIKSSIEKIKENKGNSKSRIAVVITSPTYEGITSDIGSISEICRREGVTLIVDAAHGAHFGFSGMFPESSIGYADVVISGVHKTLPAMTQTALIHISSRCVHKDRIRKMLSVFMTSSPSYVLMASIDSMTGLLNDRGDKLFASYEKRLGDFRKKAKEFEHLCVLERTMLTDEGSKDLDAGKIVVKDVTGTFSGPDLYDMLIEDHRIMPEMAAPEYIILMTGIADTDEAFERLYKALVSIDNLAKEKVCGKKKEKKRNADISFVNNMKEVQFNENREYIPVERSEGRLAADMVTVYPPGMPAVIPGEVISAGSIDIISEAMESGLEITGLKEGKIAVIWERSST